MTKPVQITMKKGPTLNQVISRLNDDTIITLVDDTKVRLGDLPKSLYNIHNRSKVIDSITWDGGDFAKARIGQAVYREWKLEKRG